MVSLILAIIALSVISYVVWTFTRDFTAAKGSTWQRALSAADDSATKLWAKFVMLVGATSTALSGAATYFNDPSLSDAIKNVLQPQYVGLFVLLVAAVTIWARNRTAKA